MSADAAMVRQALRDNQEEPEGPARNARAERLLAEAEQSGDAALLVEALVHQLQVYNYSSEKDKMFVPFARLLRVWDERPGDFDQVMTHHLFWMFKWVSSSMIDQPHIPLASIEKWQGEMAHRYRLAGHSERAVRQGELEIARHLGDLERAGRAYTAWQAADRDRMANCHACELHEQGGWQVLRGLDEEALNSWAPVLDGEHVCAHEPHAVLAASLLPLLRTGRPEQARAHHLRGYRMVRPMESMRYSVALHIEFCALTGNEARGLEILAERPAYFTDSGNPGSLMDFMATAAVLMDRLTALGHGGQSVPGPAGTDWTAASLAVHARTRALALAARFDERNGNTYVSEQVRERLARRPLLDRLPLGVRAVRLAAPTGAPAASAPEPLRDLAGLLAEAHRLSDAQHPDAGDAWRAVAERAGDADADVLTAHDRANVADHRAMDPSLPPAEAAESFRTAARLYEEAGDRGEAVAASARRVFLRSVQDDGAGTAPAEIAPLVDLALALHAEGAATGRQVSGVLVCRARVLQQRMFRAADEESTEAAVAALGQAAHEVLAFAEPLRAREKVATRISEALGFLADVAAYGGDGPAAAELYARAAAEANEAELPWYAAEYEARTARIAAQLDDHGRAERAARAALEHGGTSLSGPGRARLHLLLAEVLGATGRLAEATEHTLDAAHWADESDESATLGVHARHQLGGLLLRLGRAAEAAAVLEAVLPDITSEDHGEGMVVQTLWWLGDGLSTLGEPRAAAEHWLRAADIARGWPEQHDHAMLANLAAQALYRAELNPEAERAYERAGELWRALDDIPSLVRTLRVRAWIALREGQPGPEAARALMAAAERECEAAGPQLLPELADTFRQTAEVIANACEGEPGEAADDPARRAYEEALGYVERASAAFAEAGPDHLDPRTAAWLMAAWLEADLGRADAARARAAEVVAAYEAVPAGTDETADARRSEAASVRAYVDQGSGTKA
ncbi:tetratricopeptide repeat protein [Streptomyces laculatispora]|uniref:Tetratricopeptide repeat protein n=1 Tax=Streptomyces laculatispora TaxID=887464 RepID=A0ABY9I0M6_9ACTN|nr:tetratricopeptide repeat protein [Streptomyces laculatispora]WLQ40403.1 tetratricopeptide repeat protein [Streptomyces laculatispora]